MSVSVHLVCVCVSFSSETALVSCVLAISLAPSTLGQKLWMMTAETQYGASLLISDILASQAREGTCLRG